jgi:hypothetical protein
MAQVEARGASSLPRAAFGRLMRNLFTPAGVAGMESSDERALETCCSTLYELHGTARKSAGARGPLELAAGLLPLVGGSQRKATKLFAAWEAFSDGAREEEGPTVSSVAFTSLARGILSGIAAFGSAVAGEDSAILAEAIAAHAGQVTRALYRGRPVLTFAAFADWYNEGGAAIAVFLELVDSRKWSPPTYPAAEERAGGGGKVPFRFLEEAGKEEEEEADEEEEEADPLRMSFDLSGMGEDGEGGSLFLVRDSDVAYTARVRALSRLPGYTLPSFLETLTLGVGAPMRSDGLMDYSRSVSRDAFRAAVKTLIPGHEEPLASDRPARVLITRAMSLLYFMLKSYDAAGVVRLGDWAVALTLLLAGSKSEKLALAFDVLDGDGDGSLTQPEFSRLLRCILVALLSMRSQAHVAAETEEERVTSDALGSLADGLASLTFLSSPGQVPGRLTFADFGAFYNAGGFAAGLAFLELLDFRKLHQATAEASLEE